MPVFINGKSAVHARSGGVLNTISVNMTGDERIPVAYPNKAFSRDVKNTASRVFVSGQNMSHSRSYFAKSSGDEAGQYGGIFSLTVGGIAEFITHSPNVSIEGCPAVRAGDLMVSNYRNTLPEALMQEQGIGAAVQNVDAEAILEDSSLDFLMEWELKA